MRLSSRLWFLFTQGKWGIVVTYPWMPVEAGERPKENATIRSRRPIADDRSQFILSQIAPVVGYLWDLPDLVLEYLGCLYCGPELMDYRAECFKEGWMLQRRMDHNIRDYCESQWKDAMDPNQVRMNRRKNEKIWSEEIFGSEKEAREAGAKVSVILPRVYHLV